MGEDFAFEFEEGVVEPDEGMVEIDGVGFGDGPVGGFDGLVKTLSEVGVEDFFEFPKCIIFTMFAVSGERMEIVRIMVEEVGGKFDNIVLWRGGAGEDAIDVEINVG